MNNDDKIRELTERIEKLEKAENKRIAKKRIEIGFKVAKILIIIILILIAYSYIKPYKEKIDNINEKVDNVEKFVNDKLGGFKKYFQ